MSQLKIISSTLHGHVVSGRMDLRKTCKFVGVPVPANIERDNGTPHPAVVETDGTPAPLIQWQWVEIATVVYRVAEPEVRGRLKRIWLDGMV